MPVSLREGHTLLGATVRRIFIAARLVHPDRSKVLGIHRRQHNGTPLFAGILRNMWDSIQDAR